VPTSAGLRERKRRQTRDALINAATELFLAQGVAQTSIAQIVEKAGFAPRTFFIHFAAKEDLLFHYLEQHGSIAHDVLVRLRADASAPEAVQAVVEAFINAFETGGVDALAELRAEAVRSAQGLPTSLIRRLQAFQAGVLDELRSRYPEQSGWPMMTAHLAAAIGAAAAVALIVTPDGRAAAMRDAVSRVAVGFQTQKPGSA
jgi:AcrR family transcriptional regulator